MELLLEVFQRELVGRPGWSPSRQPSSTSRSYNVNVSEEIESLARSDRPELRSGLTVLATHVLRLLCQRERASGSWRSTMLEQATKIRVLLNESPRSCRRCRSSPRSHTAARASKPRPTIETFPETPMTAFQRCAARALNGEDFEL